jgi:aminoglycoside phosphotransferase family enzyme
MSTAAQGEGDAALAAKLRFLRSAAAYPGQRQPPECVETHMSWVFLTPDRVYKLKKPVRFEFLDFSTLSAREFNCREELRLNSRLAPGVYLGLSALQSGAGGFALVPESLLPTAGTTVDWLVRMRRLPAGDALQARLAQHRVQPRDVDALVQVLAAFYRAAPRAELTAAQYLARLHQEQAVNRRVLLRPEFELVDAAVALDRFDAALTATAGLLGGRAARGRLVEGHGDLRPEHVWLLEPPVVIDCLEFNAALRQVDPFDELAFLALECAVAGSGWIGPQLLDRCREALADAPDPAVIRLYTASRALLRARLAVAHLLDAQPRTPQVWPARAACYLACALRTLAAPHGDATGTQPHALR